MNCCAEEQGESAPGSGGMGFKVVYNRMWCPGVFLESVIPVSGNSEIENFFFFFLPPAVTFLVTWIPYSLCFIKTQMRRCYLFNTTGILTKELLEIAIFILTADFL